MESLDLKKKRVEPYSESDEEADAHVERSLQDALAGRIKRL